MYAELFTSYPFSRPIIDQTESGFDQVAGLTAYFGSAEAGAEYSAVEVLNAKGRSLTLPPGYIDVAANDQFIKQLNWP